MFRWWRKRKKADPPGLPLDENPIHTELHNHLLPRVDDGVQHLDESLEVLRQYAEWGYRRVIITPHVLAGYYPNDEDDLQQRAAELQQAVDEAQIPIRLRIAAEYFLDETLLERAKRRPLLTLGGNWVLVETDFTEKPFAFEHLVFELQVRGYRVVLAHPERYYYLHRDPSLYEDWRSRGIRFQVNLFSLVGRYGPDVQHFAAHLIEKGWVDLVGSDLHSPDQLPLMEKALTSPLYRKLTELDPANDRLAWD